MSSSGLRVAVQKAHGGLVPQVREIRRWALAALEGADVRGELTVRIVGEEESAALNERYRGKAGPTNVLAFPGADAPGVDADGELAPLGDLVICAPVVAREAREQGKSLAAHWAHMVVHGALHLLGYDHDTEPAADSMEGRERQILAVLGFPDPYGDRPAA